MLSRRMASEEEPPGGMPKRMSKWMDQILGSGSGFSNYCPSEAWVPAVNLCEGQDHYCVIVDIAGIRPENIAFRVQDGVLTITGDREMPRMLEEETRTKVHLMEIDYGKFSRSLKLPEDVEIGNVPEGRYRGGLLYVRLPKKK
ncbi:MAG: Hsp20/alpha crystallin family protein [Planctomycetes bacterium]|nr:Hsp20/alpha crystallin family protein [Planctomycetota bacterium]